MVEAANRNLTQYEEMRELHIPNDVSPPFHFSPIVPGMKVDKTAAAVPMSTAPAVKRPANLEDVAFWPVRHLAELIRTKQVTSVELTRDVSGAAASLQRHAQQRRHVPRRPRPAPRRKRADAEIAAGNYKGPLHGIPWGAKDIISVKGFKTTWGSPRRSRSRCSTTTRASSRCCATPAPC